MLYSHDLNSTENFYRDYFGLKTAYSDADRLELESGLDFTRVSPWVVYIDETARRIGAGNRSAQIVILKPSGDYEDLYSSHLKKQARIIVSRQDEEERYYRLYDPDNHIIEVREVRH